MNGQRRALRIGMPLFGGGWPGGANYLASLAQAAASLEPEIRPHIHIVHSPNTPDSVIENGRQVASLAHGSLVLDAQTTDRRAHENTVSCDPAEMFRHIDFYYPVAMDYMAGPCASWVPDLQHRHLPAYFPRREVERRDRLCNRVAEKAPLIVLSSRTAKRDFVRLFPVSRPRLRVLPFTAASLGWDQLGDPRAVAAKYGLTEPFLLCSNQFWAHKDHPGLLTAFAEAAAATTGGIPHQLVLTGPLTDERDPEGRYIESIRRLIGELGIERKIRLLGMVERTDQVQLMRLASALVHPSLFEGRSSLVEEAIALGKTVFLSAIPVHLEQEPENGVFFTPGRARELAALLKIRLASLQRTWGTPVEENALNRAAQRRRELGEKFLSLAREGAAWKGTSRS